MKKLNEFYSGWTKVLAVSIGTFAVLLVKDGTKFLDENFKDNKALKYVFNFLISGTFFSILYIIGEWLIREKLWKLKWFKKELDLSGEWHGWSYYSSVEIESETIKKDDFHPLLSG